MAGDNMFIQNLKQTYRLACIYLLLTERGQYECFFGFCLSVTGKPLDYSIQANSK